MTALTRAACWLILACILAGCDTGGGETTPEPTSPATPAPTSRPHFTGGMEVTLRNGRIVYSEEECGTPDDDRVCDAFEDRSYMVFGDPAPARLVEARMDLSEGATSWAATLVFSPESARTLRVYREQARDSGGVVLVLDGDEEVLVMAPVPRIEGRRITFPVLTKPEAWEMVERFTAP